MLDVRTHSDGLTDRDRLDWLRLIRSRRVGAVTFHRLLADHGTARAALEALPGIASAAGVERYTVCPEGVAEHEMRAARLARATMLCFAESAYPAALRDLPDAPPVLWALGDVTLLNRSAIAMVGARNASSLGIRMARRLAETLGQAGYVIVSGLARGIDAEAHAAALNTGTVAVQAGGVDVIYPTENTALALSIAEHGCRISEQPMGTEPQARHFPLRNRIVSGLGRAVVVVEAAARSGSLITARNALDQGRDVLAVPGHPFDARASGCNSLLRDGAILVRGAADVIEVVGPAVVPAAGRAAVDAPDHASTAGEAAARFVQDPAGIGRPASAASLQTLPEPPPETLALSETTTLHARILARLGPSPLAEDQLIRDLSMPSATLAAELLSLELDGLILRQAGGLLSRAV